jgi:integrase/recombinase XerD
LVCPNCQARLHRTSHFCSNCGNTIGIANIQAKENRRRRVLPLDADTLNMLNHYVDNFVMISHGEKKRLFNINRHRAWQIVRECADRAGLPNLVNPESGRERGISPHRLRDAFAVHAIKVNGTGDGLRLLQEHLGHASFNTTAKY